MPSTFLFHVPPRPYRCLTTLHRLALFFLILIVVPPLLRLLSHRSGGWKSEEVEEIMRRHANGHWWEGSRLIYHPVKLGDVSTNFFNQTKVYFPPTCRDRFVADRSDPVCGAIIPSFIIIGAEKSGTTSLFQALVQHPQVVGLRGGVASPRLSSTKELRFFTSPAPRDNRYTLREYLLHFLRLSDLPVDLAGNVRLITGEATPDYLYQPEAAERMKKLLPDAKLIVVLRDPVERSYSHFQHAAGSGEIYTGGHDFETIVNAEMGIMKECVDVKGGWEGYVTCHRWRAAEVAARLNIGPWASTSDTQFHPPAWMLQSLSRGLYAHQLQNLLHYFPPDQILVIRAEQFFEQPTNIMRRVAKWLGLKAELNPVKWATDFIWNTADGLGLSMNRSAFTQLKSAPPSFMAWSRTYKDMSPRLRFKLQRIFEPMNEELGRLFADPGKISQGQDKWVGWDYDLMMG